MRLKYRPEDFEVRESWRFDEVAGGGYHVYVLDKQKLSTFQAVERICQLASLPRSQVSYCGLKDKQGRTEQLIAVKGREVEIQEDDLRLRKVGETDRPLSARNTTSNRFAVTVRDLSQADVDRLAESLAEVQRIGVTNYFDSQRFGHLKHGQGFLAKDILAGNWEHALHNWLAKPSPLDQSDDAKVKAFWRDHWGDWSARCPYLGVARYRTVLRRLRADPRDYKGALLSLEPRERAMIVFTYQSFLWNEGVKLLLLDLLGRPALCQIPYQAGALLFPREAKRETLELLRNGTFPLLAPDSPLPEGPVGRAVGALLAREKLRLPSLRIPDAPLFFKHEERALTVFPGKLVVARPCRDEAFRGRLRVRLAFTLPPGSYATLVVRRLFWFAIEESREEAVGLRSRKAIERPAPAPAPEPVEDRRAQGFLAKKRARRAARRERAKGGTP
ncbi:MAG: tRNA pseudouridine(13) synthase TruD [Myxococcales bacterium]